MFGLVRFAGTASLDPLPLTHCLVFFTALVCLPVPSELVSILSAPHLLPPVLAELVAAYAPDQESEAALQDGAAFVTSQEFLSEDDPSDDELYMFSPDDEYY